MEGISVLLVAVGTWGDIQPFIAVGQRLRDAGHRVRLATHAEFRQVVEAASLEFFPLDGDSQGLARFAVDSGGAFPPRSMKAVDELRRQVRLYLRRQLDACLEPDPQQPDIGFQADAIIANPISYGHIHCADALGLPLHFLFTFPQTATRDFAHPQARFLHEKMWQAQPRRGSAAAALLGAINRVSYTAIRSAETMGVGDLVSEFRRQQLGAPPLWHLRDFHRMSDPPVGTGRRPSRRDCGSSNGVRQLPIPVSYVYSPSLVPRPPDWPPHVQVAGYCHATVEGTDSFQPPAPLREFLAAGQPPVYFGFGSMPVSHAQDVMRAICDAAVGCGQRAVVLAGNWAADAQLVAKGFPDRVLVIDGAPHSWLFPRCAAVCHHGGAGTTAAGLLAGRPTTIIPAFGDQPFWGAMCRRAGIGPAPIAIQSLTKKRLVKALHFMAKPEVVAAAEQLGRQIAAEPDGAAAVVDHFHSHLALWQQAQQAAARAQQQSRFQPPAPVSAVKGAACGPAAAGAPASASGSSSEVCLDVGEFASNNQRAEWQGRPCAQAAEAVGSTAPDTASFAAPAAFAQTGGSVPRAHSSFDAAAAMALPPDDSFASDTDSEAAVSSGCCSGGRRIDDSFRSSSRAPSWASSPLLGDMERGWSGCSGVPTPVEAAALEHSAAAPSPPPPALAAAQGLRQQHKAARVVSFSNQEQARPSAECRRWQWKQRQVPASARYFRVKRAPRATAWVEGCKALAQTLLLPLIALSPCNGYLR